MRIKAELFPYENLDLDTVLNELSGHGFIVRYTVESERFIAVTKFSQHQTPHVREVPSTIPAPTKAVPSTGLAQVEASPRTPCIVSVSDPVSVSIPKTVPKTVAVTGEPKSGSRNGNGHNARSKHPIFQGQRFVIFDWMLEDIGRVLGPHLNDFDVHEWFFTLDARAVKESLVKSKNDWWPWIQNELLAEAKKRGLPTDPPKQFGVTPKTAGNAESLARFAARKA